MMPQAEPAQHSGEGPWGDERGELAEGKAPTAQGTDLKGLLKLKSPVFLGFRT